MNKFKTMKGTEVYFYPHNIVSVEVLGATRVVPVPSNMSQKILVKVDGVGEIRVSLANGTFHDIDPSHYDEIMDLIKE